VFDVDVFDVDVFDVDVSLGGQDKMADFKGDVSLEVQWDNRGLYALQVSLSLRPPRCPRTTCLSTNIPSRTLSLAFKREI